jgi:hypothetical protein
MKYTKTFEAFIKSYGQKISTGDFKKIPVGKTILYMGSRYEVLANDGYVLKLKGEDGDMINVNLGQFNHGGQINEANVNESEEYAVVLTGGSIGDKSRPRDARGYIGMDASSEDLYTKDKAKEKADRMNKTVLSPGEKKYYKLKYIVVPVKDNKFIKESFLDSDTLNEAARIPSNIMDFAKRKGSYAVNLVKKAATWAEKADKYISGGTAIGKNYDTIILDMKYQGSEIYINLNDETIELFGEEVNSPKEFQRVLSMNESLTEATDYTYKEDSGTGKPTWVLKLGPESWEKVKHLFDKNGRPSKELTRIPGSGGIWDLYAQSYEAGNKEIHKIYGVSGDWTFGNAPTYYQQKHRGNKKAAKEVYDWFIKRYLK